MNWEATIYHFWVCGRQFYHAWMDGGWGKKGFALAGHLLVVTMMMVYDLFYLVCRLLAVWLARFGGREVGGRVDTMVV
jgi:hypothetical protein